jgi:methyl-accepting chemotaxis protein
MNFTGAVQAHADWKLRLAAHCRGVSAETIDVPTLAKDNVCELGKWLHGTGKRYAADPKFRELLDTHAAFHRSAALVAQMIRTGKAKEAEALIKSPDSEFGRRSMGVCACLMGLRKQYGDS